jgi:hypothetical protein
MIQLDDIRVKYESLAKYYVTSTSEQFGGYPTRAYKTGTLEKSIKVLKTFEDAKRVVFDLKTVRYGVFLNLGFVHYRSKKFVQRPFGIAAADSTELKQLIGDYQTQYAKEIATEQMNLIKGKLSKFGVGPKISPNSSTKRYTYP